MPWTAPQEFLDLYPLESIVLPTTLEGDLSDVPDFMKNTMNQSYHAAVLSQNYWREMVRAYLACISFADAMVGRVLQALSESGHDDDTTIIVFGDNGYHLGDKNIWHKLTLWEESNRVPFIIVDPSGPPGQHITKPVELVDIYSTILDYAGIAQPSWADGDSLRALVQGQPQLDPSDGVAVTFLYGSLAVVAEVDGVRWRYIRYGEGSEELYNLDVDPNQWTNLAADPLAAAAKLALRAHLDAYAAENAISFSTADGQTVTGSSGKDYLIGGHTVTLSGGAGDDSILSGIDRDRIYDGTGRDTVTLGLNVDTVYLTPSDNALDLITDCNGLEGDKLNLQSFGTIASLSFVNQILTINGEQAVEIGGSFDPFRDLVAQFAGQSWSGTAGDDSQTGTAAADQLLGQGGNDTISGEGGTDIISGGAGNDQILDGTGLDWMAGGAGADIFVLTPGDGAVDAIWDFSGSSGDKIDLTLFAAGATATFAEGILTVNGEKVVQIRGDFVLGRDVILTPAPPGVGENWTGTPSADTHVGTAYNDSLSGLAGNDTLDGSSGNDTIKGANGGDVIRGGEGNDYLSGNAGADSLFDGTGRDSLYGGFQADQLVLTAGDNSLDGVYEFNGTEGDRIDLSLFSNKTGIAYTGNVLWVNGEAVAEVFGTFDPALHLIL